MNAFHWNTGQPSILAPLQVHANIARKASDSLSAALGTRPEPVRLAKKLPKLAQPKAPKPKRVPTGRTKPMDLRVDFDKVREYRLSGKTWREVAEHFGHCLKTMHERAVSIFPELRSGYVVHGKARGAKPMPMPLDKIAKEMLAGASLRATAQKHGFSHVSLRYRLMQTQDGVRALQAARVRSGQGKGSVCYFTEMGEKDRARLEGRE